MAAALRILYLDDEPDLLDIGKIFLEKDGDFKVTTMSKGLDAIRLLEEEPFDAIISDYQMPGMDGIQFLDEVRTRFGRIPFILFTGRGREEVVIQAINRGVDFYLQKGGAPGPQFAELSHKIRQATSRKKAEDSLRNSEDQYRHLIKNSDEVIVIIQDGRLRLFNHRAAERTGYSEAELSSLPFPVLVHPDDRADVVERYRKRMAGEETPSQYTFRMVAKDGSTLWVEISVVAIVWEGRPATINFLIDITDRKWAEELVQQTRQNYEAFFNTIPEFLFVLDEHACILYTNETVTRRLGYTKEELLGQPVLAVHPPERWEEAKCTVQGMLAGTVDFCPVPLIAKDGRLFPVETRVTKGKWDGKAVIFGVSTDVSQLKLSEEKFSLAFHANASPMALSTKADGKFIEVNAAFLTTLGFTRAEVLGKKIRDLGIFLRPEDRDHALTLMEETGKIRNLEITIQAKDGSHRHGLFSADNIVIGDAACLLTTLEDITVRKLSEAALAGAKDYLDRILNTIPDPVFVKDKEHRRVLVNDAYCRFTGFAREALIQRSDDELYPREQATDLTREDDAVFSSGTERVTEEQITNNEGTLLTLVTKKTLLVDQHGKRFIVGISRDITDRKRVEEALHTSENRLKTLFRTIPDLIWVKDAEGVYLSCNPMFGRFFGAVEADIIGKTDYDFVDRTLADSFREHDRAAMAAGCSTSNEEWITFADDGHRAFVDTIKTPMYDDRGTLVGVMGIARDITDHQRAEEALRESEEHFRTIINSMQFGIVILDARTHTILEANPKALEMVKGTSESVLGLVCHRIICPAEYGICPVTDLGQTLDSSERTLLTLRGEKIPILKSVISTLLGGRQVLIESFIDISDRKLAEERLRDSYLFMQTLIETIPVPVFFKNREGLYTGCNKAFETFFGRSRDEILGKTVYDIAPKEIADEYFRTDEDLIRHPGTQHYEWRVTSKDGRTRDVLIDKATILNSENEPTGSIGVMFDITARKQAEADLLRTNEKLALLSSLTRHDALNKLTGILGYLDMLKSELDDPTLDEYFQTMTASAKQISTMIRSTREFEEIGINPPVWQDCRAIIETIGKTATRGKVVVQDDLLSGTELFANPLLGKVFAELMENAVEHGKTCRTIRFSGMERNGLYVIVCQDDGVGVPSERKEQVFEQRFDKKTVLGLALAREILAITGITLHETGEPGTGARFEMTVPREAWRHGAGGE